MTEEQRTTWQCPKDGAEMQPMGRRGGAWRCPDCRGVFIDTEAMRQRRKAGVPAWAPVIVSVATSLLVTLVVRRLRRRVGKPSA